MVNDDPDKWDFLPILTSIYLERTTQNILTSSIKTMPWLTHVDIVDALYELMEDIEMNGEPKMGVIEEVMVDWLKDFAPEKINLNNMRAIHEFACSIGDKVQEKSRYPPPPDRLDERTSHTIKTKLESMNLPITPPSTAKSTRSGTTTSGKPKSDPSPTAQHIKPKSSVDPSLTTKKPESSSVIAKKPPKKPKSCLCLGPPEQDNLTFNICLCPKVTAKPTKLCFCLKGISQLTKRLELSSDISQTPQPTKPPSPTAQRKTPAKDVESKATAQTTMPPKLQVAPTIVKPPQSKVGQIPSGTPTKSTIVTSSQFTKSSKASAGPSQIVQTTIPPKSSKHGVAELAHEFVHVVEVVEEKISQEIRKLTHRHDKN